MLLDLMFHCGSTSSLGVLLCETQVVHAVQLQNEKPDGHFWLGANYGGAAEHSTIQGLATRVYLLENPTHFFIYTWPKRTRR